MDQPNLSMRQWKWLDVMKGYDCEILSDPYKANVVADALSCMVVSIPIQDVCLRIGNDQRSAVRGHKGRK